MDFTEVVAVVGTVQGFFISLILFFLKNGRRNANRLLSMLILSISFSIARPIFRDVYDFFILFMFLFGPLFYLYVVALTKPEAKKEPGIILHAVPFIAAVCVYLIQHIGGYEIFYGYIYQPMYLLKNIHPLIYSVYIIFYLKSYRQSLKEKYSSIERISLSWITVILFLFIFYFMVISPLTLVFFILGNNRIISLESDWTPVIISFYIFFLGFNGIRHHEVFVSAPVLFKGSVPGYSEQAAEELINYMNEKKPYLSEDLTLDHLSKMTEIADYQISRIINRKYRMNFFDFVNSFRIDYFNNICRKPENAGRSILDLAFDSGFYSKSTFNLSYKKRMGITPSQYIKGITRRSPAD